MSVRVTVVDDDRDMLYLFRDLFEALDEYEIAIHTSALPGVEELVSSKPDLLVVDLSLAPEREELSGMQVIHAARSAPPLRNVPIIVSYVAQAAIDAAWPGFMERGDIHQLAKPFDLATFERVVAMALGRTAHGPDDAGLHPMPDGEAAGGSR